MCGCCLYQFQTFTLNFDPNRSVFFEAGRGWKLSPVIEIAWLTQIEGNFLGSTAGEYFVININNDRTIRAIASEYSKYVMEGIYSYNSSSRTAILTNQGNFMSKLCFFENLKIALFANIPEMLSFRILDWNDTALLGLPISINIDITIPAPANYRIVESSIADPTRRDVLFSGEIPGGGQRRCWVCPFCFFFIRPLAEGEF